MPRLRTAHLRHRRHDLRQDPNAALCVVRGVLAVRDREGRRLGAELAALTRDRVHADRVGDAAPLALGACSTRTRAPQRDRRDGRDVPWRCEARCQGRAYPGRKGTGGRGGRAQGAERVRALPAGGAPRRSDAFSRRVPRRPRGAWFHRRDRRLAALPRSAGRELHPRALRRAWRARPHAAARRPPRRQPSRPVAARHPPGRCSARARPGVPGRSFEVAWGIRHVRGNPLSAVADWFS